MPVANTEFLYSVLGSPVSAPGRSRSPPHFTFPILIPRPGQQTLRASQSSTKLSSARVLTQSALSRLARDNTDRPVHYLGTRLARRPAHGLNLDHRQANHDLSPPPYKRRQLPHADLHRASASGDDGTKESEGDSESDDADDERSLDGGDTD